MRKMRHLFWLVLAAILLFTVQVSAKTTSEKAREAYASFLAGYDKYSSSYQFIIMDLNNDGIPELRDTTGGYWFRTYKNGSILDMMGPKASFDYYYPSRSVLLFTRGCRDGSTDTHYCYFNGSDLVNIAGKNSGGNETHYWGSGMTEYISASAYNSILDKYIGKAAAVKAPAWIVNNPANRQKYLLNGKLPTENLAAPVPEAAENCNKHIQIRWKKVNYASGYHVYRKAGSGSFEKIASVKGNAVNYYNDTNTHPGTTYSYQVAACNAGSQSKNSTAKTIIRLTNPTGFQYFNSSKGIQISWKKVTGAGSYNIYRKSAGSGWSRIGQTSALFYLDKTAADQYDKTYVYTVRGVKNGSISGYSETGISVYRLRNPLLRTVTNYSYQTLRVEWKKVSAAHGYEIQYSTDSKFSSYKAKTVSGSGTVSTVLENLASGKTYYVRVRAYRNINGTRQYGVFSNEGKEYVTVYVVSLL